MGSRPPAPVVLFTDLDGTLLDPETYAWEAAAGALRRLLEARIPVVFCSSKTRAEQEHHREEMGVPDPFIVENGSAVVVPAGSLPGAAGGVLGALPGAREEDGAWVVELGPAAAAIRERLLRVREETGLPFRGYGEMSVEEVAGATGLGPAAARRARAREYSETVVGSLSPEEWVRLDAALARHDLAALSGGRHRTVVAAGVDKGRAVRLLAGLYRRAWGEVSTAGIGDAPNDGAMLRAVDRPYLVRRPGGGWAPLELPGLRRVGGVGPAGWAEAVEELLREAASRGRTPPAPGPTRSSPPGSSGPGSRTPPP